MSGKHAAREAVYVPEGIEIDGEPTPQTTTREATWLLFDMKKEETE